MTGGVLQEETIGTAAAADAAVDDVVAATAGVVTDDVDDFWSNNLSAVVFAVISLIIYMLFLRPTTDNGRTNQNGNDAAAAAAQRQRQDIAQAVAGGGGGQQRNNNGVARRRVNGFVIPAGGRGQQPPQQQRHLSDSAVEVLTKCKSKPPHMKSAVSSSEQLQIGGTNALIDGLVAFPYTHASTVVHGPSSSNSSSSGNDDNKNNNAGRDGENSSRKLRQDRAKILSRVFAATGTSTSANPSPPTPPPKGSTLVIGISSSVLADATTSNVIISKVLYNLATYYTVMVMVQVVESKSVTTNYTEIQKLQDEMIRELRTTAATTTTVTVTSGGDSMLLTESVLPSHRIMISQSSTGRVALTRQLSSVELVVDFDDDVRTQLERFGYKVAIISDWVKTFGTVFE
jgi:hypothetical protein